MIIKAEYIWLDGYEPEPNLRSKTKTIYTSNEQGVSYGDIPEWNFDGSSTKQADGNMSDCILKPIKIYQPKKSKEDYQTVYVLCEVMNPDGTPHESNKRALLGDEDPNIWFGFEQEYFLRSYGGKILGMNDGYVETQGRYYCGVGHLTKGRDFVNEHYDMCLNHGIQITGINAEVAIGQWEYQVFAKGKLFACDDLWMTRYFLNKLSEKYNYHIELHPKPLAIGEWNGSGLHTNFSNKKMRESGNEEYFKSIFSAFEYRHENHIEYYGSDNHLRLTGKYETQSINKFSWGVSDRGASIRVPQNTAKEWKGYLEDRRPSSNANPYDICLVICESLKFAEELSEVKVNMYSNVGMKNIDDIAKKYNAKIGSDLLNEYKED
jgi:glutamine synthetase